MMADPARGTTPDNPEPGDRPLRILLITDKVPSLDKGYGIRVHNVLAGLRSVGHVTACLVDSSTGGVTWPADDETTAVVVRAKNLRTWRRWLGLFGVTPGNVRYEHEHRLRSEISTAVADQPWDVVWCSRARVHLLTSALDLGARIVDLDDLNDDLLRSRIRDRSYVAGRLASLPLNLHHVLEMWRWRRLQRALVDSVDRVVVCSDADAERLGARNAVVVPNGYPRPSMKGATTAPRSKRMVVVGSLIYEPNRLAVQWFVRDVLPRIRERVPAAELVVVGAATDSDVRMLSGPGVVIAGHVPDVGPYYADSAVAVVPLHSGAGTRLKVLEALARDVPLVSTSFGVRGHPLEVGTDVLVADDPAAFAAACVSLLDDHELAARLASHGRARYEASLSEDATIEAVRHVVQGLLAEVR